jgi:hypothetical protein
MIPSVGDDADIDAGLAKHRIANQGINYCEGFSPTMAVPSDPRSKTGDGLCDPGDRGSGLADTQQAIRSTSLMVFGHADCDASGSGAGLAHAAKRTKGTIRSARIFGRCTLELHSER